MTIPKPPELLLSSTADVEDARTLIKSLYSNAKDVRDRAALNHLLACVNRLYGNVKTYDGNFHKLVASLSKPSDPSEGVPANTGGE